MGNSNNIWMCRVFFSRSIFSYITFWRGNPVNRSTHFIKLWRRKRENVGRSNRPSTPINWAEAFFLLCKVFPQKLYHVVYVVRLATVRRCANTHGRKNKQTLRYYKHIRKSEKENKRRRGRYVDFRMKNEGKSGSPGESLSSRPVLATEPDGGTGWGGKEADGWKEQ